ncbi:uncharacterized protein LOC123504768 isoform X2 [Portunus trituberculatus]|uniref:uncharacterized protein LOC123504768 isoform X2 n=1 Tax=Portunus trituberculatus TaxID=210409 RepID=UPI001E1CFA31|nr:uncharacterized protein LOC123504768 isoform X2 [Portunus trituberculatus]
MGVFSGVCLLKIAGSLRPLTYTLRIIKIVPLLWCISMIWIWMATCMLKRIAAARFSVAQEDSPNYDCPSFVVHQHDLDLGDYLHAEENCCCKILKSGPGRFTQLWFVDRTMIHTGGPLQVFKMATCMLKRIAAARFSVAQEDSPNYGLLDGQ